MSDCRTSANGRTPLVRHSSLPNVYSLNGFVHSSKHLLATVETESKRFAFDFDCFINTHIYIYNFDIGLRVDLVFYRVLPVFKFCFEIGRKIL